jgi:hypothetical protein
VPDSTTTPWDVAIMAPDSARACSFGSSVTRATANEGLCLTSTCMLRDANPRRMAGPVTIEGRAPAVPGA